MTPLEILMRSSPVDLSEYDRQVLARIAETAFINKQTGCLEGTRLDANGRPRGQYKGKMRGTSRVVLTICTPQPAGKDRALHSCDNPACIHPEHLRWGTPRDNAMDREARKPRRLWRTFTPEMLAQLLQLAKLGYTQIAIAKKLGVSQPMVSNRLRPATKKDRPPINLRALPSPYRHVPTPLPTHKLHAHFPRLTLHMTPTNLTKK